MVAYATFVLPPLAAIDAYDCPSLTWPPCCWPHRLRLPEFPIQPDEFPHKFLAILLLALDMMPSVISTARFLVGRSDSLEFGRYFLSGHHVLSHPRKDSDDVPPDGQRQAGQAVAHPGPG